MTNAACPVCAGSGLMANKIGGTMPCTTCHPRPPLTAAQLERRRQDDEWSPTGEPS